MKEWMRRHKKLTGFVILCMVCLCCYAFDAIWAGTYTIEVVSITPETPYADSRQPVEIVLRLTHFGEPVEGHELYRFLFLLPMVAPGVVNLLIWKNIYDANSGLMTELVRLLGIVGEEESIDWLGSSKYIIFSIIFMGFPWLGGTSVLIYMSGLMNISTEVIEASRLDGAGTWTRIFRIDLPLLMGQIRYFLIFGLIGGFQDYGVQVVLTSGGPDGYATYVPGYYMYELMYAHGTIGKNETGLYFMLFRQGSTYYYNVLTFNSYGRVETIVANCAIGTDLSEIVIRVEKLTGDPSRENHVVIYVNDQKNENFSVNQVQYSDLVDNENFTYLSVGAYGGPGGEESRSIRSGVITRLFFADHTAPEISLDGMLPEKADLGSLFRMPGITIADNVDETFYADVKFYDPLGNILTVPEEGVALTESGQYTLVIKAQDSSGNKTIWIHQIEVGGEEGGTLPVWPFAAGSVVLAGLIGGAVWLFLKKRPGEKQEEG